MREEAKNNPRRRLLYCDVESKWKNYHIITFRGQSLSKTLEEAMDLSQDRLILELEQETMPCINGGLCTPMKTLTFSKYYRTPLSGGT
jgi:hypothetical protein